MSARLEPTSSGFNAIGPHLWIYSTIGDGQFFEKRPRAPGLAAPAATALAIALAAAGVKLLARPQRRSRSHAASR